MTESLKRSVYTLLGMALVLITWIIISSMIKNNELIFPGPIDTFRETIKLMNRKYTYECMYGSISKTFIGFLISFIVSLILGTISGNIEEVRIVLSPIISVMKSIPTASLVFLFLVLFGAKDTPIAMVVLISFPIMYESIVRGYNNIDRFIVLASRVDGASFTRRITRIYFPNILPYMLVGIASSFSLSFKIEIMSEVISGSTSKGLGSIISACQKSDPTNMVPIFAYSLITIVIVGILSLILYLVEKRVDMDKA